MPTRLIATSPRQPRNPDRTSRRTSQRQESHARPTAKITFSPPITWERSSPFRRWIEAKQWQRAPRIRDVAARVWPALVKRNPAEHYEESGGALSCLARAIRRFWRGNLFGG